MLTLSSPARTRLDRLQLIAGTSSLRDVRILDYTACALFSWRGTSVSRELYKVAAIEGTRSVSIVRKRVPYYRLTPDGQLSVRARSECGFYLSALRAQFPDGIRAPRCYAVECSAPGLSDLLLEDCGDHDHSNWRGEDYVTVARSLGRMAGYSLRHQSETPVQTARLRNDRGETAAPDALLTACGRAGVASLLPNASLQLLDELRQYFDSASEALARGPTVICHNDLHKRHVFLAKGTEKDIRLIDWGCAGPGPLGSDLSRLIIRNTLLHGDLAACDSEILAAAIREYVSGLCESDVSVDLRLVKGLFAASWSVLILRAARFLTTLVANEGSKTLWSARSGAELEEFFARFVVLLRTSGYLTTAMPVRGAL